MLCMYLQIHATRGVCVCVDVRVLVQAALCGKPMQPVRPPEPPSPLTDKARPSAKRPCPCLTRPLRACVSRWQIAEHPCRNDNAQRVT